MSLFKDLVNEKARKVKGSSQANNKNPSNSEQINIKISTSDSSDDYSETSDNYSETSENSSDTSDSDDFDYVTYIKSMRKR
jgi:hypothetical protein